MDFSQTPAQRQLRQAIVAFSRAALNPGVIDRDRQQAFSRELWKACADLGLTGLPAPVEFSGAGLDHLSCALALEAFGYGCTDHGLVFSVGAHLMSCVVPLTKFGSDDQKRRYLPGLCQGTSIGVHAMTEAGSGSDPFAMRCRAVKDGAGWRI